MIIKKIEKDKAVKMRMEGKTYTEILQEVKVSRSTLSIWLRDVGLSKPQKQRITKKRLDASKRGAAKKKSIRINKTKEIERLAAGDIKSLSKRDLWLMGTMLYWAEGSKPKELRPSVEMSFGNSDPRMLRLYILWLKEVLCIKDKDIRYRLYIHENSKHRMYDIYEYWAKELGVRQEDFKYVYFKKHKVYTKRKNIGDKYFGLVELRIRRSTDIVRKIMGWVKAIDELDLNNSE